MSPAPDKHPAAVAAVRFAAVTAVLCPFLISGIAKALDSGSAVAEVRALTGLEPAWLFAPLVIPTQLGGSLLVLLSARWAWLGAGALARFTVVATLLAHAFWTMPEPARTVNRNILFEHVSIVGGLLLAAWVRTIEAAPLQAAAPRTGKP